MGVFQFCNVSDHKLTRMDAFAVATPLTVKKLNHDTT